MVGGLDLHRAQITFDIADIESGEVWRGRLWQPDRQRFRRWLTQEVARPSQRRAGGAGSGGMHRLAVRGRGDHRGRVSGASGRASRHYGGAGSQASRQNRPHRLPGCCASCSKTEICPSPGSRRRSCWSGGNDRLYKALVDQRTQWVQRIHAELYQHGVAVPEVQIRSEQTRAAAWGDDGRLIRALPASGSGRLPNDRRHRRRGEAAARTSCTRFGRRQPACRALIDAHYGIGGLIAVAVWSELGDCRRFTRSARPCATPAWT